MADNKVLQTRIKLKIDTLTNWQSVWSTFVPLKGEKILFQIWDNPETTEVTEEVLDHKGAKIAGTKPPQVISKTGDGVTTLENLPWDSALAADVAAWAKKTDPGVFQVTINNNEKVTEYSPAADDPLQFVAGDNVTLTTDGNGKITISATDENTDTKVTQNTALTEGNVNYPVILGYDASTTEVTNAVNKAAGFTYNPATKTLTVDKVNATLTGTADEAAKVANDLVIKGNGTEVEKFNGGASGEVDIISGKGINIQAEEGKITISTNITAGDLGIDLTSPLDFVGITTTKLEDGDDTNPIILKDGSEYTAVAGDIVILDNTDKEFLFYNNGTKLVWEELGEASAISDRVAALEDWKTKNWKPFSTIDNGYTNASGDANNILFGDNTWAGAVRDDFIVFDCGSATMSEAEKTYATTLS